MTDNLATVIGAHTHVQGRIEGDQDLNVLGRVDGQIALSKTLTVDANGVVVAEVQATRVLISGTLVGNVSASELIHIAAEGRVVGDLISPRIVIDDGASFRGNVDMGDLDAPLPLLAAPRAAPRARTEPRPVQTRPAPRPEPALAESPEPRRERQAAPRPSRAASEAETLESRAEAAAEALSRGSKRTRSSGKESKAPAAGAEKTGKKSAPKPPTAAGKRSRARKR